VLRYGRGEIVVPIAEGVETQVLRMRPLPPLANPEPTLSRELAAPHGATTLDALARGAISRGQASACLVVCDITRPVPNALLLAPTLRALEGAGIARGDILILVATGLHRPSTPAERHEMLGADIASAYRIEDHDARDEAAHAAVGGPEGVWVPSLGRRVPAAIDRRYLEAGVKVVVGLAEPHFMAGYSGGRKMVCPGLASAQTIFAFHSPEMIGHPASRSGSLEGNPVTRWRWPSRAPPALTSLSWRPWTRPAGPQACGPAGLRRRTPPP
jgi:nickel-dependent lactate racemase